MREPAWRSRTRSRKSMCFVFSLFFLLSRTHHFRRAPNGASGSSADECRRHPFLNSNPLQAVTDDPLHSLQYNIFLPHVSVDISAIDQNEKGLRAFFPQVLRDALSALVISSSSQQEKPSTARLCRGRSSWLNFYIAARCLFSFSRRSLRL